MGGAPSAAKRGAAREDGDARSGGPTPAANEVEDARIALEAVDVRERAKEVDDDARAKGRAVEDAGRGVKDPRGERFSVTTAINYANGAPHMGHAYESISTDVLARYHRAYGRQVLFQTGSDEHGQKIAEAAEEKGMAPLAFVDTHVAEFQNLNKRLDVSNDVYLSLIHI